jgi:hypothetical protein
MLTAKGILIRIWSASIIPLMAAALMAISSTSRPANSAELRERKTVIEWRKTHPCPATGKATGACPGWKADHVWSLCLGGPDVPENLKWQSATESYLKDVFEREMCAMKRKLEATP